MLINNVNLEIGGQEIDKQYCDWFNIWNELSISPGHKDGYADMIGNTKDLVSTEGSTDLPAKTLYVPLQFWFNRNIGLALIGYSAKKYTLQDLQRKMAPIQINATCTSESQTRDNFKLRGSPKTVNSEDLVSPTNPHKASGTSQILERSPAMVIMKTCNKCDKEKPEDAFELRRDSGKRRPSCLECQNALKMAIHRRKHPEKAPKPVDSRTIGQVRTCRTCDIEKPLAEFPNTTAGGFDRECRSCRSAYCIQYKREINSGDREKREYLIDKDEGTKRCSECQKWKPMDDFPKRDNDQGRRHQCRECFYRRTRLYYENNEGAKMGLKLRKQTYACLFQDGKHHLTNLTNRALRSWFEFQFGDDLSWDNYPRVWTIDHVVPVAAFDLTDGDQYRMCAHWTNLQPHRDNLGKNNSIRIWEVMAHKKRVEEFIGENENLSDEYPIVAERLRFLEHNFGIGKNLTDEVEIVEIPAETDDPQRSP